MQKLVPLMAFGCMLLVTGCSTIVSGTEQAIFVDTPKVEGATCALTDSKKGSWNLPSSPGSVSVHKGDGPMNIVCKKEGYETTIVSVDEETAGATFGNIIAGGGIGFLVDAASGAAQIYPDKVTVWMKPLKWDNDAEEKAWLDDKAAFEAAQAKAEEEKRKQRTSHMNSGNS